MKPRWYRRPLCWLSGHWWLVTASHNPDDLGIIQLDVAQGTATVRHTIPVSKVECSRCIRCGARPSKDVIP